MTLPPTTNGVLQVRMLERLAARLDDLDERLAKVERHVYLVVIIGAAAWSVLVAVLVKRWAP